jgi:hypothetical protein
MILTIEYPGVHLPCGLFTLAFSSFLEHFDKSMALNGKISIFRGFFVVCLLVAVVKKTFIMLLLKKYPRYFDFHRIEPGNKTPWYSWDLANF